jgi:hypothetical protein
MAMQSRLARIRVVALAALALAPAVSAAAEEAAAGTDVVSQEDVSALRREIQTLRDQVRELKDQVQALMAQGRPVAQAPQPVVPAGPAGPGPRPAAVPPARTQNLMNPAISGVFQMIGNTSLKRRSEANGFDLSEAEFAFQSVVDPYAKVDIFLAFPADESPEVEEGFVTTLALPGSMQLKGGRFKSAFGKWNGLHTHAFFTVDRPDALSDFFGEESLTTDGLSLSVLIPNPWGLYFDSITEIGTARPGPAFNDDARHLTYLERLSIFFTPTPKSNFEVGLTGALGRTGPGEGFLGELDEADPSGGLRGQAEGAIIDSAVQGIDLTYKWKPPQMNVYRSFLWQTEFLQSRRDQDVLAPGPSLRRASVTTEGGYSYLEWQFAKRWRFGGRYDRSAFTDREDARIRSASAVVRFAPSEFQEFRFQVKRTRRNAAAASRFGGEPDDTRIFFEWIPVIGAHGAHKF